MKTYVINLERARARRAFMEAQLQSSGLQYEFVDAVDGYKMTPEDRVGLVDEAAVSRSPAWLTPGMVGCILSHRKVYELIRDAGSGPAMVLEDDAVLPRDIAPIADAIASAVTPDGLVLLDFRSMKPCRLVRSSAVEVADRALFVPTNPHQPISGLAYIVGEEAAARMATVAVPVRWGPDSWGEYVDAGAVGSLRCTFPRVVKPSITVRSMTRHDEIRGVRDRALESWPVQLVRRVNRWRIAWLMNRVEFVD